jgi:hypothetical protein
VTGLGGGQRPGDSNQDGELDLSDAVSLLLRLFGGGAGPLPCEGDATGEANRLVLDVNHDATIDVTDAIYILNYLFKDGPAPVAGNACIRVEGCPSVCRL